MDNYAIYLRKSRKDLDLEALGEGETLSRHRTALLELAAKQGLNVVKIYEEMVSGESIEARPQMQQLLEDVWGGEYKGVLVMEVERLARGNTKDQGEVSEAFAASKTLIVTPTKTYDPTNEFDEEYFEFGLFMSRREYKTIRRRMERGLLASIKEGNYVGSVPPYGYDIIRINKKERTLKPNEQSKYVEMMFNWFVNDKMSAGQIARQLTGMGVPTQTGKLEWNRSTVKDILQNNLYTGMIRWNRRKTSKEYDNGKVKRKKRRLTSDDYLVVPGKHPALISQEIFDKAQTLWSGNAPVKANNTITNPFARLMFCKHCGKAISYASYAHKEGKVQPRMVHRESELCKVKSAFYDDVLNLVIQGLKMQIADFDFKLNNAEAQNALHQHQQIVESLKKELKSQESKRMQLFEYLESGIYTKEEFMERKAILVDRIEKLKANIEAQEKETPTNVDYQELIYKFTEVVDALSDSDVSAKRKNDLLKGIIKKIEYDCEDLGRGKGGNVILDIHFKDQYQVR